jgi:hypothetical protein
MNGPARAARRARVHAIGVVVLLAASALEVWAVAGGQDLLRDGLLLLIALTMVAVAAWG